MRRSTMIFIATGAVFLGAWVSSSIVLVVLSFALLLWGGNERRQERAPGGHPRNVLTLQLASDLVRAYGAVLERLTPLGAVSINELPNNKDRIKQAILLAYLHTTDTHIREQLRVGNMHLALFTDEKKSFDALTADMVQADLEFQACIAEPPRP